MVEILKRIIESRVEQKAYKLHCILQSQDETNIEKLDELLTEYVLDINKIKMLNEMISSSQQNQQGEVQPEEG